MEKEQFEEIIKPLRLLDNSSHRDFITKAITGNFNRWKEKYRDTNNDLLNSLKDVMELLPSSIPPLYKDKIEKAKQLIK